MGMIIASTEKFTELIEKVKEHESVLKQYFKVIEYVDKKNRLVKKERESKEIQKNRVEHIDLVDDDNDTIYRFSRIDNSDAISFEKIDFKNKLSVSGIKVFLESNSYKNNLFMNVMEVGKDGLQITKCFHVRYGYHVDELVGKTLIKNGEKYQVSSAYAGDANSPVFLIKETSTIIELKIKDLNDGWQVLNKDGTTSPCLVEQ